MQATKVIVKVTVIIDGQTSEYTKVASRDLTKVLRSTRQKPAKTILKMAEAGTNFMLVEI